MKIKNIILILVILTALTGCTFKHDYARKEHPINSDRILLKNNFSKGNEIRIIKGQSDDSQIFLGALGTHEYYGSKQSLTDGIVDQLTNELKNKNLVINNTSDKSLEIVVINASFEEGMWVMAATLEFTVRLGNGKNKSYTVKNKSGQPLFPSLSRTYNGAVAFAVIKILNDKAILAYIGK